MKLQKRSINVRKTTYLCIDVIDRFAKFYTHKLHFDEVMAIDILTVISYLDVMFVLVCTFKNSIYIAKIVHNLLK